MLHALVLALAIPTSGPVPAPTASAPASLRVPTARDQALIVNSGSTNRAGYRLHVDAGGWVSLQQANASLRSSGRGVPLRKRVPSALVDRLFADLKAAGPLDALTSMHCMKSASFGSATQIGYLGKMSPDVSCPGSASARKLDVDAQAIAAAAGAVSMRPRAAETGI